MIEFTHLGRIKYTPHEFRQLPETHEPTSGFPGQMFKFKIKGKYHVVWRSVSFGRSGYFAKQIVLTPSAKECWPC